MICILKMEGAEIKGWIIAVDVPDARRMLARIPLEADEGLAAELYRMEFAPPPGKYRLSTGHIMLVS